MSTHGVIRDVPDAVVAAVDAHAVRLGLSRSEYVRRRLAPRTPRSPADLTDPDVMGRARRRRPN